MVILKIEWYAVLLDGFTKEIKFQCIEMIYNLNYYNMSFSVVIIIFFMFIFNIFVLMIMT